jgi:hypothetical protein
LARYACTRLAALGQTIFLCGPRAIVSLQITCEAVAPISFILGRGREYFNPDPAFKLNPDLVPDPSCNRTLEELFFTIFSKSKLIVKDINGKKLHKEDLFLYFILYPTPWIWTPNPDRQSH